MRSKSTNRKGMSRPSLMLRCWFGLPLVVVSVFCTCSRPKTETAQHAPPRTETAQQASPQAATEKSAGVTALPTQAQKTTGDLGALLQRRTIRVVVPFSRMQFYVLKGVKRGISYEGGKAFQAYINRKCTPEKKHLRIHVVFY